MGEQVDIGQVGDVTEVNANFVLGLLDMGYIPVVSSVARDANNIAHNVNADSAAAALAIAVEADQLIVLTDVEGVYADWPNRESLVSELSVSDSYANCCRLWNQAWCPKMEACLRAVEGGVPRARVIDGRVPGAVVASLAGATTGTVVTGESA